MEKIFADINNTDPQGRIRLTTVGTLEDIEKMNIKLSHGLEIMIDDHDEFIIKGIVQFSNEENIWVCKVNWNDLQKR